MGDGQGEGILVGGEGEDRELDESGDGDSCYVIMSVRSSTSSWVQVDQFSCQPMPCITHNTYLHLTVSPLRSQYHLPSTCHLGLIG